MNIFNLEKSVRPQFLLHKEKLPCNFEIRGDFLKVDVRKAFVLDNKANPGLNVLRHRLVDGGTKVQAHREMVGHLEIYY